MVLYLHGAGERGTDNLSPLLNESFAFTFLDAAVKLHTRASFWFPRLPWRLWGAIHAASTGAYYPVSISLSAVTNLLVYGG